MTTPVHGTTGSTWGLLHNPDYAFRWERKLAAYRAADILPHEEDGGCAGTLIITRDDEVGGH